MGADKVGHFKVGGLITLLVSIALMLVGVWALLALILGVTAAFVAGIVKEIYDYKNPENHTVEFWDFLMTGSGGAVMGYVLAVGGLIYVAF